MPTTYNRNGVKNTYPEKYIVKFINAIIYEVDEYIHTPWQYKQIKPYRDCWNEVNVMTYKKLIGEIGFYIDQETGYYQIYEQFQQKLYKKCAVYYLQSLKELCSIGELQYFGGEWKLDRLIKQYEK